MYFLYLIVFIAVGYFCGSTNHAIIITRLVAGKDIRKLGNKNAGAANVNRSVGKGWGTLVFFLDLFKGFIPILIARIAVFSGMNYQDFFALYAVGFAAVLGHCRPVFYHFKGGRGISTSVGIMLFFIPVEATATMLLGALIVALFIKNVKFRIGRWIPIVFTTLTPFLVLAVNPFVDIPLFAHVSIGGHPWYILVGTFGTALLMLFINLSFMGRRIEEYGEAVQQRKM